MRIFLVYHNDGTRFNVYEVKGINAQVDTWCIQFSVLSQYLIRYFFWKLIQEELQSTFDKGESTLREKKPFIAVNDILLLQRPS